MANSNALSVPARDSGDQRLGGDFREMESCGDISEAFFGCSAWTLDNSTNWQS
jgi:hypothetical protein